jgi:hypothetical protein
VGNLILRSKRLQNFFFFFFFFCFMKFGYFVPNSEVKTVMILSSPCKAFSDGLALKAHSY